MRRDQVVANGVVPAILALFGLLLGGCSIPQWPDTLPDSLPNQVYAETPGDEFTIQVGHLLNDDLSEQILKGELRGEGVLGIYLRVENVSGSRLLISAADCRLFAQVQGSWREVPQVPLPEVVDAFERGTWFHWYINVPFGILLIPVFFAGYFMIKDSAKQKAKVDLWNAVLYEHFLAMSWNKRALGPGEIHKGLLFYNWELAEPHYADLRLAVDIRDLVHEWHVVLPVQLNIRKESGIFSDDWF